MQKSALPASHLRLKRAYEPPDPEDGVRILVDRLWPRGVSKAKAALDDWMKEIAPSATLRQWFGHDPARWAEFQRRYRAELQRRPDELDRLRGLARTHTVTLVYGAQDEAHNDAVVLKDVLLAKTLKPPRPGRAPAARGRRSPAATSGSRSPSASRRRRP
jgi:uncharacterized protein YeaO (DUF488 family)